MPLSCSVWSGWSGGWTSQLPPEPAPPSLRPHGPRSPPRVLSLLLRVLNLLPPVLNLQLRDARRLRPPLPRQP